MIKIKIYQIGKNKDKWLDTALHQYETRLTLDASFEWITCRDSQQLEKRLSSYSHLICLDRNGLKVNSLEFKNFFYRHLELQGATIRFVIGDAEGLPEQLLKNSEVLSFSPLTFTHQMTRLILVEQIYRAIQIHKGTKYHK